MPTLEEVHLGLGSGEVTFGYDPELLAELVDYRHLLCYRHGKLLGTTVILAKSPSREGITVSGYGLGFWLSVDNDGSIIERREYIAGNNQLDNGDFEVLDALDFPLLWENTQAAPWTPDTVNKHGGARAMRVTTDLGKDMILRSTEPRDLSAGALVGAGTWAKRLAGTLGRLRLRAVFEGRYDPSDLLPGLDASVDFSLEHPGDTTLVGSTIVMGPVKQRTYAVNGGFETGDLSHWFQSTVGWNAVTSGYPLADAPRSGTYAVLSDSSSDPTTGTWHGLQLDPTPVTGTVTVHVIPGQQYRWDGYIKGVSTLPARARLGLLLVDERGPTTPSNQVWAATLDVTSPEPAGEVAQYKYVKIDYDVPLAASGEHQIKELAPCLVTDGGGAFLFDDVQLTRTRGNWAARAWFLDLPVTPERTYRMLAPVTADAACTQGAVKFQAVLAGEGRPNLVVESSTVDYQAKSRTVLSFDITPPSGYDRIIYVHVYGMDILGGPIVVNEKPTLTLTDTSTSVVDLVIGPTLAAWTQETLDTVAPAGTQKFHLELVAEAGATGFVVDDVEWHRREAITPSATIVDELLKDPDTDDYLVNPGTIHTLPASGWDWLLVNQPAGAALLQFLRGGRLSPAREFRINPDNTIDVGTAAELSTVRSALKLVEEDLLLLDPAEVKLSVEHRVTRVKTIGVALQRHAPLPDAVIVGLAETVIPGAFDWNGNPVRRTRLVVEPSLNFRAFANARAADELDSSALVGQSIMVGLSDWAAWGDFNVGDWLPVYKPEALLEDRTNPDTYRGRRIFPVEKRVLSRKLRMARGDGFHFKVRRPDGTLYDVADNLVRWDATTKATLELGDERLDFANDPQGPAAGVAYARWRAMQAV